MLTRNSFVVNAQAITTASAPPTTCDKCVSSGSKDPSVPVPETTLSQNANGNLNLAITPTDSHDDASDFQLTTEPRSWRKMAKANNQNYRSGFLRAIRRVVMARYCDLRYSNAGHGKIPSKRGVQQGDPSGPLLFALGFDVAISEGRTHSHKATLAFFAGFHRTGRQA